MLAAAGIVVISILRIISPALAIIGYLIWVGLAFGYFTVLIGGPEGQTVGMRLLGIAVEDVDVAESIGYGRAAVRYLVIMALSVLCSIPLIIDFLSPLWDQRRQAWHDMAARSIVVTKRKS